VIHGLALATLTLALGSACSSNSNDGAAPDGIRVVATTAQIAALAREVGGDRIDLRGIVPAGADAHDFEPVASDLVAIERADVILRHGAGLDDWLDHTLDAAGDATVVTVTDGIELQPPALAAEDGDTGLDPHVWHDPDLAIAMLENVAQALRDADPNGHEIYDANSAAYAQELRDIKAGIQALVDEIPPDRRKLVTNHDAFGYFARAFGLTVVGAVIPGTSTQAEASAKQTAALLELIRRENVKAIFAESSVNASLARTLADDAGVRIVDDLFGDSLGPPGSGADTVDGMLLANARKIAAALK
jgi:ABC-type Zn uptake system ZnuABC Zn-binding protein ZnuA